MIALLLSLLASTSWAYTPLPVSSDSINNVQANFMDLAQEMQRRDLTNGGTIHAYITIATSARVNGDFRVDGATTLTGLLTIGSMTVTASPGSPPTANTIYKNNIPKALIFFSQSTDVISDSFNISSITDGADGQDVVNIDRDFANTGYAVFAHHTCQELGNCIASQATGSVTVSCYNNSSVLSDCTTVSVFVFGNQ